MVGIALIVCGILGLAYGGFTYTRETHEAKIGPLVLSVVDKETLNVPSGSAWGESRWVLCSSSWGASVARRSASRAPSRL